MTNPLEAYLRRHGHYPRIRRDNGSVQRIEVSIAPGYATITTYPQGHTIYIPHSSWREVLRFGIKTERYMREDFDVPLARKEAYEFEQQLQREQRQFKKTLYRPKRRNRRE